MNTTRKMANWWSNCSDGAPTLAVTSEALNRLACVAHGRSLAHAIAGGSDDFGVTGSWKHCRIRRQRLIVRRACLVHNGRNRTRWTRAAGEPPPPFFVSAKFLYSPRRLQCTLRPPLLHPPPSPSSS